MSRRTLAQLVRGPESDCRWTKPDGPAIQNEPSVHALECSGGAPSTDCSERLPRRGVTHDHHHRHQTESVGLLPNQGGQKQTQKKLAATDAIFEQLSVVKTAAQADATVMRISMDAKASVKVGDFSRGGKKRVQVKAADHDFKPSARVTPVGILLQESDELFLACVTSKVTSDCLVDVLEQWWQSVRERFAYVKTLVINLDNGPENQSHRTQFLKRLVAFAQTSELTVKLAYYPPYHSKYNPVERCWGVLEHHWNGDVLDTVETVVKFAQTMTWKGKSPVVQLLTAISHTAVRLSKLAMAEVETHVQRLLGLERWFVEISCTTPVSPDT